MKRKSIFLIAVLLIIGIFFQYLMIETSPRIPCDEIKEQLLKSARILIYQFMFLIFLLSIICKLILKETTIEIVKKSLIYTFLYILFFMFLFYKYASKCVEI